MNKSSRQVLQQFWTSVIGSNIIASEQEVLQRDLGHCWGQQALQVCNDGIEEPLVVGKIERVWRCAEPSHVEDVDFHCSAHQIPVETDRLQAVLLQHVLEFDDHPHSVLREVQRILAPRGRVAICVINRYSWLALRMRIVGIEGQRPLKRAFTAHQLRDWLHLLGFELEHVSHTHCCTSLTDFLVRMRLPWVALLVRRLMAWAGDSLIITARKDVNAMVNPRERWRVLPADLIKARSVSQIRSIPKE